jgi:hypothetical protein
VTRFKVWSMDEHRAGLLSPERRTKRKSGTDR